MRVFVSSRMDELARERKVAIDYLHAAGHTPLYIETEPLKRTKAARARMDHLLEQADALVLIYYLSRGSSQSALDVRTPIQFEYETFRRLHPEAPIVFVKKEPPHLVTPSGELLEWIAHVRRQNGRKTNFMHLRFAHPSQLAVLIGSEILSLIPVNEGDPLENRKRAIIRYSGPDYVGLIGDVTEELFSRHTLNVDYISFGARAHHATLQLACSSRSGSGTSDLPDEASLMSCVNSVISRGGKRAFPTSWSEQSGSDHLHISVSHVDLPLESDQLYLELNMIDAPGQLSAVCKVLRRLEYNVDDLHQRPAGPESPRQMVLSLWVSKGTRGMSSPNTTEFAELQTAIDDIVGVRSHTLRYVYLVGHDRVSEHPNAATTEHLKSGHGG